MDSHIEAHNVKAAATWNAGAHDYDRISERVADAIEHCVLRLAPRAGERVLDVGTGTGWAARRIAARGSTVVGVDLGPDLIEAAKNLAREAELKIDFRVGDAEKLAFGDQTFDVVISTFGVMFVSQPERAAGELARVCRKGGRLGLATWPPGGTVAELFQIIRRHVPTPPAPTPSPLEWGRSDRIQELLGRAFDLRFETGTTVLREPSGEAVWELFATGFGPVKALSAALDVQQREQFKRDFIRFHEQSVTDLGVAMPRDYLVTIGTRR